MADRKSRVKAVRRIKPNESSATRDTMRASRRSWGEGKHIDKNGNKDHEFPEDEAI